MIDGAPRPITAIAVLLSTLFINAFFSAASIAYHAVALDYVDAVDSKRQAVVDTRKKGSIVLQTITTSWMSGGEKIIVTTPAIEGETGAQHAQRHKTKTDEMKTIYPVDPPAGTGGDGAGSGG